MKFRNRLAVTAWIAAAIGAVLFVLRLDSAVSFTEPLHLITSGYEQQPLMGIWRAVHGLPVYTDFFALPYYSGHYNWLFYEFYGAVTKAVAVVFGLGDAWMPTVARMVTLAASTGCAVLAYRTYVIFSRADDAAGKALCGAFAVIVAFGPLIGFWGFTARSDIFRLLFEMAAILAFWNAGRPAARAVIAAALLCYVSWAFKHSAVTVPVALVIYCLLERRFRDAAVFSAVLIGLYGVTFALASEHYLPSLVQGPQPFSLSFGIRNLINFAQKSTPQIFGAGALVIICLLRRDVVRAALKTPELRYIGVHAAVALAVSVSTAAIVDAAENYYFLVSHIFAALAAAAVLVAPARPVMAALAAGFILYGAAVALVLTGRAGVISVADQHERNEAARVCMAGLPEPAYADEQYLQLPWMTPGTPLVFTSHDYFINRAAGREFEKGGVGGLIESGAFGALYVSGEPDAPIDGARLSRYVRDEKPCAGRWIYRRKPQP